MKVNLSSFKNNANLILAIVSLVLLDLSIRNVVIKGAKGTSVFIISIFGFCLAAFWIYLSIMFWTMIWKKILRWINFVVMTIALLVIFVIVYLIALNNDTQIDTTANARYTLSDQSIKILKNLKKDVNVYGFYGTYQKQFTLGRQAMDDLLEQYTLYGNKFIYKLYNINKEPEMAEKYKAKVPGTLVVVSGAKEEIVAELTEDKVTNAIIRVSRERGKKVYFLEGHGERGINKTDGSGIYYLNQQLKNMSYETETLKLPLTGGIVPEDCDLLVIPGLRDDLFPIELKGIYDYLKRGGSIYLMIDPGMAPSSVSELDKLGIKVGKNIVVMNNVSELDFILGNIYTPITNNYGGSEITKDFTLDTVYDKTRSIESSDKLPQGVTAYNLVSTTDNTHTEILSVDPVSGTMKRSGAVEKKGPIPLGVALEIDTAKWTAPEIRLDEQEKSRLKTETIEVEKAATKNKQKSKLDTTTVNEKSKSRFVVMGDSEFAMDYLFARRRGNFDFVLNTIAWLTEETDLISVRPPHLEGTPIFLSDAEANNILWSGVIELPLGMLIVGWLILRERKRRYLRIKQT